MSKPMFHIMEPLNPNADLHSRMATDGYRITATFHVSDEAGLLAALEERPPLGRQQTLACANAEALEMLLKLSVRP